MDKRSFLKAGMSLSGFAFASTLFPSVKSMASTFFSPQTAANPGVSGAARFVSNPMLETLAPERWMGTPLDTEGRFRNLNFPFVPRFSSVLKWKMGKNPMEESKRKDAWQPGFKADGDFLSTNSDCIVWLGHASFFLRMNGKNILIDPVFGRATVVKRLQLTPYPAEVWKNIHLILVSHDHRDHCDVPSLKILAKQNPEAKVLSGLGMKKLLSGIFPAASIEEAGWYQKFRLAEPEIWFLPGRHWSRRSLSDTNLRLWGAFYLKGSQKIFFMGDSGLDTHFGELPGLHEPPDLALMGIGAYCPEWFMHPSHMSPEDSWKSFQALKAKTMLPMHFGTFDLSDEPASEPLKRLQSVADAERLILPSIGETWRL